MAYGVNVGQLNRWFERGSLLLLRTRACNRLRRLGVVARAHRVPADGSVRRRDADDGPSARELLGGKAVQTIRNRAAAGKFPRPTSDGVWLVQDVADYLDNSGRVRFFVCEAV